VSTEPVPGSAAARLLLSQSLNRRKAPATAATTTITGIAATAASATATAVGESSPAAGGPEAPFSPASPKAAVDKGAVAAMRKAQKDRWAADPAVLEALAAMKSDTAAATAAESGPRGLRELN